MRSGSNIAHPQRRGVVYVILTLVMLPVFAAFISMAIEMMSIALSTRVAFNYAMIGTSAIARSVELSGGGFSVNDAQLCAVARQAICQQTTNICDKPDGIVCLRRNDTYFVRVRVPRYIFFNAWVNFLPPYADGYNIIKLEYGINQPGF